MPEQIYESVDTGGLFDRLITLRGDGYALSQILATHIKEGEKPFDVLYAMEKGLALHVLRVSIGAGEELQSVSGLFPYAYLYENEMKDLFGINVVNINVDFKGNLYKIAEKTPFYKEGEK